MDGTRQEKKETARTKGGEPSMASAVDENPALGVENLMEEVCEANNMRKALKRVTANKGASGADGMPVGKLKGYLQKNWPEMRRRLLEGKYKPSPVKRVEIPKPAGGVRKLGIPTVLDRLVQQAVLQKLQPMWDPTFSDHSYGFRPRRSAREAVAEAHDNILAGYGWVVDIDLEKFFDLVNHDRLMARLSRRIGDKRLLKLIGAFLRSGVMDGGLVSPTEKGTPQGGPLSPLLSNIVLDELDWELEGRGHRFVRYADDCNIYVRSEKAGLRVMESVSRFIEKKLKLKVNKKKSAVGKPNERKFLSFTFTDEAGPLRMVAPQAIKRFKRRIREITARKRGRSLRAVMDRLSSYLIGWRGYFGYAQVERQLAPLNGWIRRRLRCFLWKQWRTRKNRYKQLRKRGVGKEPAAKVAGSSRGLWCLSACHAVHIALPNSYFDSIGLPRLAAHNA